MTTPIVDFSFLYDLAENDTTYIHEVVKLYINNIPDGIANLEKLINGSGNYEAIQRQAHSLKSSAGIIKVREMYDDLAAIDSFAKKEMEKNTSQSGDKKIIIGKINNILLNFKEALPVIVAERDKNKPAK